MRYNPAPLPPLTPRGCDDRIALYHRRFGGCREMRDRIIGAGDAHTLKLAIIGCVLLFASSASAADLTGTVTHVRDGDTIEVDGVTIRLHGLHASARNSSSRRFVFWVSNPIRSRNGWGGYRQEIGKSAPTGNTPCHPIESRSQEKLRGAAIYRWRRWLNWAKATREVCYLELPFSIQLIIETDANNGIGAMVIGRATPP
jgi:hypothetical protein